MLGNLTRRIRRGSARPDRPVHGRSAAGRLCGLALAAVTASGCAGDSVAPGTPPARAHHRLVSIPPGEVLLVGGSTRADSGYVWFDDVWSWRANAASWISASPLPFTRSSHALAYDPARSEVVLIGGIGGPGDSGRGGVWISAGEDWQRRDEVSGDGWAEPAACYDRVRERVVVFGGWDRDNQFRGDTWEWDGRNLERVTSSGPGGRAGHDMAFDPVGGRCLMFGGRGVDGFLTETWAWDGEAWEMVATSAESPPPRWFFGMATDDRRDRIVVFGGASGAGGLDDTWEWNGAEWARVDAPGPPARGMGRLAFDGQRVVLFGGRQSRAGRPPFADLADTWAFDGERWSLEAADPTDLVIVDVHVVPMTADTVLMDHAVLVRDGRIAAVTPMSRLIVPTGAAVLDAGGRFLVPGLVDFHVHLRSERELDAYLRHGVTTIVNLRGTPDVLVTREALRDGSLTGPRMFTSGPLLDGDPPIWSGDGTRVVTTAADARAAVAAHVAAGYDFVKVYNNLDPDVLAAVDQAAREAGLAVIGHLPRGPVRSEGLRRGLGAGIDLIAHAEEIFFTQFGGAPDSLIRSGAFMPPTDDELREVAELIATHEAAVTPNLSFVEMTARMLSDLDAVLADAEFESLHPATREMWREQNPTRRPDLEAFTIRERLKHVFVRRMTAALHEAGVPLLVGTDASAPGMYPGKSAHVELAALQEAGLPPFEVLRVATRTAGDFLARHVADAPAIGRVEPGYAADLIIVDGDPRADLSVLARPWRVLRDGRPVYDGSLRRGPS